MGPFRPDGSQLRQREMHGGPPYRSAGPADSLYGVREAPFTTLRVEQGEIWFAEAHWRRLEAGARHLGFAPPARADLVRRVVAAAKGIGSARVRVTLAEAGEASVEVAPLVEPVSPWRLLPIEIEAGALPVAHKTTARARYERAKSQAAGWDDALLVTAEGVLLETTIANLFLLLDGGRLWTSRSDLPLLAGIARGRVLSAAARLGLAVMEAHPTAREAASAVACFVTNALLPVHPVAEIAGVARFPASDRMARHLIHSLRTESLRPV